MKRIIYTNSDGGVSVIVPAPECELSIEEIAAKDVPAGADYEIVNVADIPSDRTFRNAWFHDKTSAPQKVGVDMGKAKELTKERLRAERAPLLAAQDVAFQRAMESGADTTAIVAEKQRLRDITMLANSETTLDGLRALKAQTA
jgi:hypothetical protein